MDEHSTEPDDELIRLLDEYFSEIKKQGCSIPGCTAEVAGSGEGKPYCGWHFWQEIDK